MKDIFVIGSTKTPEEIAECLLNIATEEYAKKTRTKKILDCIFSSDILTVEAAKGVLDFEEKNKKNILSIIREYASTGAPSDSPIKNSIKNLKSKLFPEKDGRKYTKQEITEEVRNLLFLITHSACIGSGIDFIFYNITADQEDSRLVEGIGKEQVYRIVGKDLNTREKITEKINQNSFFIYLNSYYRNLSNFEMTETVLKRTKLKEIFSLDDLCRMKIEGKSYLELGIRYIYKEPEIFKRVIEELSNKNFPFKESMIKKEVEKTLKKIEEELNIPRIFLNILLSIIVHNEDITEHGDRIKSVLSLLKYIGNNIEYLNIIKEVEDDSFKTIKTDLIVDYYTELSSLNERIIKKQKNLIEEYTKKLKETKKKEEIKKYRAVIRFLNEKLNIERSYRKPLKEISRQEEFKLDIKSEGLKENLQEIIQGVKIKLEVELESSITPIGLKEDKITQFLIDRLLREPYEIKIETPNKIRIDTPEPYIEGIFLERIIPILTIAIISILVVKNALSIGISQKEQINQSNQPF